MTVASALRSERCVRRANFPRRGPSPGPGPLLVSFLVSILVGCGSVLDSCGSETRAYSVHVSPTSVSLQAGDTARLTADVRFGPDDPPRDHRIEWSSSDTSIVTVDSAGTTVARGTGSARIYARAGGVSGRAYLTVGASADRQVAIPEMADWVDRGAVLEPGPPGSWDRRLYGALSPAAVVKKDGRYFLYYIGASGPRSSDGGPAYRTLGLAVSGDGVTFAKHATNPVITHFPDGGHGNEEEEGVFSGGAWLDDDGEVVLYFGGMESTDSTQVDGDGVLATSVDGIRFQVHRDVIVHDDPQVFNHEAARGNDELFPVTAYKSPDGVWHSYYVSKGHLGEWILGLASGRRDRFTRYVEALNLLPREVVGTAGVVELSPRRLLVPIRIGFGEGVLELRTATPFSPAELSEPVATWVFPDLRYAALLLDRERRTWFLYYVSRRFGDIRLKTAPIRFAEGEPT